MSTFPDELAFISFFNTIPTVFDKTVPFYYNDSTFSFEHDRESFKVKISPSINEFELTVVNRESGEVISFHSIKTVGKVEILSDKRELAKLLIILDDDRDRFIASVEITFRPSFSLIHKEHFK
jgi:hypothetical protein